MDRELLVCEGVDERDECIIEKNDQEVCKDKEEENYVEVLWKTVEHFYPGFNQWLEKIPDVRDGDRIEYELKTLIWSAVLMFMSGREARKQIGYEMRTEEVVENVKLLSGQINLKRAPHGDTVEYSMVRQKTEVLGKMKAKMVGELLRKRVLERDRLLNRYYTIAVDAVHEYTFDEKHCDHCLVKEDKKGKKVWQHIKLVANLVTANGLCLPVVTEWIENEGGKYKKQDCELKAFYRLVPKIRQRFPRLEICLLLDSLYCGEPTFELLKAHRMEGIIVFKEGSMPEVFEWAKKWMGWHGKENVLETSSTKEIQLRCPRTHEDRLRRNKPEHKKRQVQTQQTYRWMERLPHWDETREFNILTCKEVVDGQVQCNYIWLVTGGIRLNRKTVEEVANQGGRKRWVIENKGFNTQKNGGYQLEHAYSKDAVSMKCWNELLDIAHIFRQLIEKGSLIQRHLLGPTINLGKRLFEHLRYYVFEKPEKLPRIQIRFAWPDTS